MKVSYLEQNVYEAALDRIRWLYDRHDHVGVSVSGGKDSTVVLNLTLEVARERGALPLDVMFVDQEAEWVTVIEHMREIMAMPDVRPHWLQVPIRISNGTSPYSPWLNCWEPGEEWMREREPDSIHENVYGTRTFADLHAAWQRVNFPGESHALVAGIRTEESPSRRLGLTMYETAFGETWGKKPPASAKGGRYYTWYPIYDWRLADVWHAIHVNGWPYCPLYDRFYQYGVAPSQMRVSNLHHETAIQQLMILQEIEPETWDAMVRRLSGTHSAGQLNWQAFRVKDLPAAFRTWDEYRDHLLEHLVVDDAIREKMRGQFVRFDARYRHDPATFKKLMQTQISCILVGDDHGTKLTVFEAAHLGKSANRGVRSGRTTIE